MKQISYQLLCDWRLLFNRLLHITIQNIQKECFTYKQELLVALANNPVLSKTVTSYSTVSRCTLNKNLSFYNAFIKLISKYSKNNISSNINQLIVDWTQNLTNEKREDHNQDIDQTS